jgi:KaiC/GvpD/RAD55 family RecA-like ATPase
MGKGAIVVATESHRDHLLPNLQAHGLDMGAVIDEGRYIALDASAVLATFILNGMPDTDRFMNAFDNTITTVAKAARSVRPRVVFYGEGSHLLWLQGDAEAAIQTERISNQLTEQYDVDILCGYFLGRVPGGMDDNIYQRICTEHSAVYSR